MIFRTRLAVSNVYAAGGIGERSGAAWNSENVRFDRGCVQLRAVEPGRTLWRPHARIDSALTRLACWTEIGLGRVLNPQT